MSSINLNRAIRIAYQTGKIHLGSVNAIKLISMGKAKMAIIASNSPPDIRDSIEVRCQENKTPLLTYPGSGYDLASAVGKPFMVNVLTVEKEGDSNLLKLLEGQRDG